MKSAILFMVLAMSWLMPAVQGQGLQPELSVVVSRYDPFPAEPGKYMTLWIKVQNVGAVAARNVTIELLDTYPFSLDESEQRTRTFGEVLVTEPLILEYRVRVDSGALDGRNRIDLKISSDGMVFFIRSFDITVESKVVDFAIGSLVSEPERLVSGTENNKLTISLQNIGEGDAKLVSTELMLPEGFIPSESYSDEYAIGSMPAESAGNAVFYIDIDKSVQAGEHMGTLKVFYKDGSDGEYKRKTLQVRLPVRSSPSFEITEVEILPADIGQGMKEVEMRISIINSGSREAENVNIRILKEATQPFDFKEKSNFVGSMEANGTGQAVFHFDVDNTADLKKYIMEVEIRYTTDSTVNIVNDRISFEVTEQLPDPTGVYIFLIIFLVIVGMVVWFIRR